MNNEPVAWLHIQGNYFEASDRQLFDDEIERGWEQKPLYTHPVKELTLTPDEIYDIWDKHADHDGNFVTSVDDFVGAILRKAQER